MTEQQSEARNNLVRIIQDAWYQKWWRPAMAGLYFVICALDFVVMPIVYASLTTGANETIEQALRFENSSVQIQVLETLRSREQWEPITLASGGLIHISFGAFIAGYAITRGIERTERVRALSRGWYAEQRLEPGTNSPRPDNPDDPRHQSLPNENR